MYHNPVSQDITAFNDDDIHVVTTVCNGIENAVDLHLEYLKYFDSRGAGLTFGAYDPYKGVDMAEMLRITCIKANKPSEENPSVDANIYNFAKLLRKAADMVEEHGKIQEG